MSLNYTTLQALILATSAHSELTAEVPGFVRQAEGLIRRVVRAQETRVTLDESDRSSAGIYNLPATIQEVRAVFGESPNGDTHALENVGLHGIRMIDADSDVLHYAVTGNTIEFRGVPGTDEEMEVIGFGWPALLTVSATNDLLTYHEGLYLFGGLHFLYTYTQDLELAQFSLQQFNDTARHVNEMIGRKIGGGSVLPAYNFGHITVGRGY
jgi:hypothetical protein